MTIPASDSKEWLARLDQRLKTILNTPCHQSFTLVVAAKYATIEQLQALYRLDIVHFGENRLQDALTHQEALLKQLQDEYGEITWHFIGHLQRNKVKKTVGRFALIHSVDTVLLAEEISSQNLQQDCRQDILLQVNIAKEPSKHGFLEEDILNCFEKIHILPGLRVVGLMTMAPHDCNEADAMALFSRLANLKTTLETRFSVQLPELSMGMSRDYVHALKCGATILRLGSILFK